MKIITTIIGLTLLTGCSTVQATNENTSLYQSGVASYYGAGEKLSSHTANGERFNPSLMTAAHRTLPFGTKIKVVNVRNNKSVIVKINDRGPFNSKIIDLTYGSSKVIDMKGSEKVKLYIVK